MSGKNRALALAAATAALVGLSAPVAGAATLQGPSGFNNDSILNLSGNQIPIAACNLGIPVDALLAQVPISALNFVDAGTLNSTTMSPTNTQTCSPSTTQGDTSTTNTNSNNASVPTTTIRHIVISGHHHHGSLSATSITTPADTGTSGFNGDSVLNVSNNQIPATICNVAVPITATGVQVPVSILNAVLGGGAALNSTTQNPTNTQTCTPSATQDNGSTFNTNSNNG